MANESAGTLSVAITGDVSSLLTALDQAQQAATSAGTAIAEALSSPAASAQFNLGTEIATQLQTATEAAQTAGAAIGEALTPVDGDATAAADSISAVSDALQAVPVEASAATDALTQTVSAVDEVGASSSAVDDVVKALDDLSPAAVEAADSIGQVAAASGDLGKESSGPEDLGVSLNAVTAGAGEAQGALSNAGNEATHSGESAHEASGMFGDLGEQLLKISEVVGIGLGLEELGKEAISAASQVQQLTTSFTLLTGSSETAAANIETLKETALTIHQPFSDVASAAQQMSVALGGFDNAVPLIEAAGNAANFMGTSFDAAASKLDRMALSGTASAKSLATLGLSTDDLAAAFNKVGGQVDATAANISAAFKALDVSDRIAVIVEAMQKMDDASTASAGNMKQQWQDFKTQFEFDLEEAGTALTPFIQELLGDLKEALATVQPLLKELSDLIGGALKDNLVVLTGSWHEMLSALQPLIAPIQQFNESLKGITGIDLSGLVTTKQFFSDLVGFASGMTQLAGALQLVTVAELALQGNSPQQIAAILATDAALKDLGEDLPPVTNGLKGASIAMTELGTAATNTEEPTKTVGTNLTNAGIGAGGATGPVKSFSDALAGLTGASTAAAAATKAWYQEAHNGVTAIEEVEQALQTLGLSDKAVNDLLLQMASDADTSTASFTKFGTALPLTTEVTTGLGNSAAAVSGKIQALGQDLYGVSENGKIVVPILQSTADKFDIVTLHGTAAANSLDGVATSVTHVATAAEIAAGQITALGAAQVYTNGVLESAATEISNVNAAWDANASKVQSATDRLTDATNANTNFLSPAYDATASFNAEATAAQALATAANAAAVAVTNAAAASAKAGGKAGGNGGGVTGSSFWGPGGIIGGDQFGMAGGGSGGTVLGEYASVGASGGVLDQIAQALGLIPVGINQYVDLATFNNEIKASGLELNSLGQLVVINSTATTANTTAKTSNTTATAAATTATTNLSTAVTIANAPMIALGASATALGAAATGAGVALLAAEAAAANVTTTTTATATALGSLTDIAGDTGQTYQKLAEHLLQFGTVTTDGTVDMGRLTAAMTALTSAAQQGAITMTSDANTATKTYATTTDALTALYEQVGMTTTAAQALAAAMTTVVRMSAAPSGPPLGTVLNTAPLATQTPVAGGLGQTLMAGQTFNIYGQPISDASYQPAPSWTGVGSGLGNNPPNVFNVNVQSPSYQQTANQIISALRNNASLKI